jgi:hypothetical protein
MPTVHEIEEQVARSVAAMAYLDHGNGIASAVAVNEIHDVAASVGAWDLTAPRVRERFLRPVEAELIARYGPREGARLNREFLREFEA